MMLLTPNSKLCLNILILIHWITGNVELRLRISDFLVRLR